jgi:hypothetical protein
MSVCYWRTNIGWISRQRKYRQYELLFLFFLPFLLFIESLTPKRPIYLHQHTVSLQLLGMMSVPRTFIDSQDPMWLKPAVFPVFLTPYTLFMLHELTALVDNYAACRHILSLTHSDFRTLWLILVAICLTFIPQIYVPSVISAWRPCRLLWWERRLPHEIWNWSVLLGWVLDKSAAFVVIVCCRK